MTRPTKDEFMMALAKVASMRTTCIKRAVGCVLADEAGHVLAIGYNGVAAGMPHCNDVVLRDNPAFYREDADRYDLMHIKEHPHACIGHDLPSGQDSCEAVHAEQNAILQCKEPGRIHTAYVTTSPCKPCVKLLMNTGCERIVFLEEHTDPWPKEQWLKLGRRWERLEVTS